jgi:hypothetical protein
LYEGSPNTNVNNDMYWAGMYFSNRERMLVSFQLSGYLPANAKIKKAYLVLYCADIDGTGSTPVALHKMTGSWDVLSVTWNSRILSNAWAAPGGDYNAAAIGTAVTVNTTGKYYTWEVDSADVQGWLDSPAQNYGIMVKSTAESAETDAAFSSNSSPVPEQKPRLVVYYGI